jgi:hypothetical protein
MGRLGHNRARAPATPRRAGPERPISDPERDTAETMSRADVELVRNAFEAYSTGGVEHFDDVAWEIHEIRDTRDRVLVRADLTGQMKSWGVPIRHAWGTVCSDFRDGMVGKWRFFSGPGRRPRGRRAAGIGDVSEPGPRALHPSSTTSDLRARRVPLRRSRPEARTHRAMARSAIGRLGC